jgi:hypothetical protein
MQRELENLDRLEQLRASAREKTERGEALTKPERRVVAYFDTSTVCGQGVGEASVYLTPGGSA